MEIQRIMVFGAPGSGKSTLARQLGARTGLPVVHLDQIFWKPGWEERPRAEANAMIAEVQARARWIIDGNRSALMPARAARAELMVYLDHPLWRRLWRVVRRTVRHRGQSRPDLQENCPERFSAEFLWYIVRTARRSHRFSMHVLAAAPGHVAKRHLKSDRAVAAFLAEFTR